MSVEKLIHVERSHRRVLLGALAVIAVFGLYRWILAPHTEQLMAAEKYNSTLDEAIHKAGFISSVQDKKRTRIEELTGECDRLRNQLFTQNEARQFLASLPSCVTQSGCIIQSVSAIPDAQKNPQGDSSGIISKKANLIFVGGYNNILKLLELLQNNERKVWIESVKLGTGDAGKLKCQVVLTLYCIERVENN
jgi:Tfp pilus assembly protein PilO